MFRNLPSRYAKARLLPTLMLQPSGFLYNTRNAESYTLNPVAACLVAALQRGIEPDALWNELVYHFEVGEPQAHCDTLLFLRTLHQLGLLSLPKEEEEEPEEHAEADEPDKPDKPDKQDRQDEQGQRSERTARAPGGGQR